MFWPNACSSTRRIAARSLAVAVLIELMLDYGEGFEKSPDRDWAMKFLEHPELPAPVKVGVIRDRFAAGKREPMTDHGPDGQPLPEPNRRSAMKDEG